MCHFDPNTFHAAKVTAQTLKSREGLRTMPKSLGGRFVIGDWRLVIWFPHPPCPPPHRGGGGGGEGGQITSHQSPITNLLRGAIRLWAVLVIAGCVTPAPPPTVSTTGRDFAVRVGSAEGILNFARINDTLYRGAHPSKQGVETLKKMGVKTVICLRQNHTSRKEVEAAGMKAVEIPMHADIFGSTAPSEDELRAFFGVVLDPDRQPVFFHCAHGKDRTGTMAALYRIEMEGWRPEEAIEEMQAFGYHDIYKDLINFVRTYKPRGFKRP